MFVTFKQFLKMVLNLDIVIVLWIIVWCGRNSLQCECGCLCELFVG